MRATSPASGAATPAATAAAAPAPTCGDRGFSIEFPVFTPAGQAAFDKNIPSYGREKDSADAKAHPEEHIGRRRAQPPALGNDPYGHVQPDGRVARAALPRPGRVPRAARPHPAALRVALRHPDDLDGRAQAAAEPAGSAAVVGLLGGPLGGRHAVVESVGHDDRTWVDYFGYPHSDVMQLEERYRRISADTLELSMTVTDAKYYAKPWKSQTKQFKLLPKGLIKTPGRMGRDARGHLRPDRRVRVHPHDSRPGRAPGKPAAPTRGNDTDTDVVGSAAALRGMAGQHVVRAVAGGVHVAHRVAALGPLVRAHAAARVGGRLEPATCSACFSRGSRRRLRREVRPVLLTGLTLSMVTGMLIFTGGAAAVLRGLLVPAEDGAAGDDAAVPLHRYRAVSTAPEGRLSRWPTG